MSTLYYSKWGTTRSCEDTHIMNLSSLIYLGVVTCQKVHLKIIVGQQKPKIWRPIFVLFKLFYTKGLNKHVCKGLSPHILERERKGEGGWREICVHGMPWRHMWSKDCLKNALLANYAIFLHVNGNITIVKDISYTRIHKQITLGN